MGFIVIAGAKLIPQHIITAITFKFYQFAKIELICYILRCILAHWAFVEHSHILHLILIFDWHNVILSYIKVKSYGRMTKNIIKKQRKTVLNYENRRGDKNLFVHWNRLLI